VTGGTFDKEYDELEDRLFFRNTHLSEMLELGRCKRTNKSVASANSGIMIHFSSYQARRIDNFKFRKMLRLAVLLFACISAYSKPPEENWTEKTLKGLPLREKIAQLVQIRVPGKFINRHSPEFQAIRDQIRQYRVGGVVLFAGNVYESAMLLNELQTISRLPLLVSADFERGAAFRIADTTSFPWTMALGATGSEELAYRQGLITAQESRSLGVHWIFAPVMDVNNNPDNPVINIRSFGEDPALVARLGSAFIRGAKKGGVLTAAKHFPGHGDTTVDSHIGLPLVESDLSRLQSIEFAPFRSAIEAGVDSIMTAHVAVPRVTGDPEMPATLSSTILTDLLRNELKFGGLVVTDALEMAGVTNRYWCGLAAVRAIQAGADILLLPPDAAVAINEIERAVHRGDISEKRIEQSVKKILDAKRRMGLSRKRLVSIERIGDIVSSPQNIGLAREIAEHSITAVKDDLRILPINVLNNRRVFSLVLSPDLESSPAATFQAEMRRRFPSIRTIWGNARIPDELLAEIDKAVAESDLIVCSTMVRLASGQDAIAFPESQRMILKKLVAAQKPTIWVALGNPYVLRFAPEIGTYLCTFSYSEVSQIAAAKALAGEIDITGRMPISMPPFAKAGDGVHVPKIEMILEPATLEALDLPKNAFENTRQILSTAMDTGVIPGAELVIGYRGKVALDLAIGKTSFGAGSAAVSANTIYDLGSLSRPVSTGAGILLAIESGSLIAKAPIQDYVPEFKGSAKTSIRDAMKDLSTEDVATAPGLNAIVDVLETIVSRVSGFPSDRYLARRLFDPLGMKNIFRNPPVNFSGGIAGFEGTRKDALFGNAKDLAVFAQMLLNRGVYKHRRYFSPEAVAIYTGSQGPWSKPSNADWTGQLFSTSSFGRRSSGGSLVWIDPAKQLSIVFLTNARIPAKGSKKIDYFQQLIGESIVAAIDR
jgi:beta-N-acetylhexosaminidase